MGHRGASVGALCVGAAFLLWGCGGDDGPLPDSDGGSGDASMADGPERPVAPEWSCPDGWQARTTGEGISICDPFAGAEPVDCGPSEADFPGEAGCVRVGTACPADGLVADLPSDRPVFHALQGADAGGDGSAASPYARLNEALSRSAPGSIVALGRGTYEEIVRMRDGVTIRGACVEQTAIRTDVESRTVALVTLDTGAAELSNLRLGDSPRFGARTLHAGTVLTLADVVVAGAREFGVHVFDGAHLDAQGLVVRDTASATTGVQGSGLTAEQGGSVEVSRAAFERNGNVSVAFLAGAGASTLSDVVIRDTRSRADTRTFGRGLAVEEGSVVEATRAVLIRNREVAIFVGGEGAALGLGDALVRDTLPTELDRSSGRGLEAVVGARVDVSRSAFERNREVGVYGAEGVSMRLSDVVIADTLPDGLMGLYGRAINIQDGSELEVLRLAAERAHDVGLYASGAGTIVNASDLLIRDVEGQVGDRTGGFGVAFFRGAGGSLSRLKIERTRTVALDVALDASLEASDLTVLDTRSQECPHSECGTRFGVAVGAYARSTASITRFALDEAELCGIHIADGGEVDLMDGEVSRCTIGACVQVAGYDVDRLTSGVAYRDNGENLEATMLPIPDALEGL